MVYLRLYALFLGGRLIGGEEGGCLVGVKQGRVRESKNEAIKNELNVKGKWRPTWH